MTSVRTPDGAASVVGPMDAELAFLIAKHRQSGNTATLNFLLRYESLASIHADLLAALEAALPRMAHRIQCYRCRPTEEWAQHGSVSLDGCECEIQQVRAAIAKAKGLDQAKEQQ